ncbi:6824_t:CDS:10 [Ambispora gerdemannii]|uniref:Probable enoyl-CoA hydratase, mitochondrial n=1 Tax=Ambispora gerdemannii TaxID=144530 RepID=A0A9N8V5A2_9GLOM|nr:6824_t:CDS:10 [Ambispora gerdemannii]
MSDIIDSNVNPNTNDIIDSNINTDANYPKINNININTNDIISNDHIASINDTATINYSGFFEGPEKLLEVWFGASPAIAIKNRNHDYSGNDNRSKRIGLRQVKTQFWKEMLEIVKCQIISVISNDYVDAYLLSESSLFVYPHKLILKTCGTTKLLLAIPQLLKIAAEHCHFYKVWRVFYSRKRFMFPKQQLHPHKDWENEEVTYLDNLFDNGAAYIVGRINADYWNLYLTSPQDDVLLDHQYQHSTPAIITTTTTSKTLPPHHIPEPPIIDMHPPTNFLDSEEELEQDTLSPTTMKAITTTASEFQDQTIEILMTNLDSSSVQKFYQSNASNNEAGTKDGARIDKESGLANLYPGAKLDSFLFTPCGYSANALLDENYFTVHVTPEPSCSYASFESNIPLSLHYNDSSTCSTVSDLIRNVISIFNPGKFSVTLFTSTDSRRDKRHLVASLGDDIVRFVRKDRILYELDGYDLIFAHFEKKSRSRSYSKSRSRSLSYSRSRSRSLPPSRSRRGASSPAPLTKIIVEKLTKNVTVAHLQEIFGTFGTITHIDLPINKKWNANRGIAYIEYSTRTEAERAVSYMDGGQLDGTELTCAFVPRRPSPPPIPARRRVSIILIFTTKYKQQQDTAHHHVDLVQAATEAELALQFVAADTQDLDLDLRFVDDVHILRVRIVHVVDLELRTQGVEVEVTRSVGATEGTSEPVSSYKNILIESNGKVGLITLNRPKALNALSSELFHEINDALEKYQNDPEIGAIVITGSDRAFAAGADIKEMQDKTFAEVYKSNFLGHWGKINEIRKPIIAAVNGFALGGGCELAMSCDIVYAGVKATFGQPEIKLGVIPGAGGTQRLTRAIGKSKAMEIVLSGRNFTAEEAERWGIVSKVLPVDKVLEEAINLAQQIASLSQPVVQAGKESVNNGTSFELSLKEGCHFERRLFQGTFALRDQKEGMKAFIEKREPKWTNE